MVRKRIQAELAQQAAERSMEDTPENKALLHSRQVLESLRKNPNATQLDVDQAVARLRRLNDPHTSDCVKNYWGEFELFNAKWQAKIDAEVKMKADEAADIAAQALEIQQQNTLENKASNMPTITLPDGLQFNK